MKDKSILITGGTGSFGNAMIRRLINSGIGEIRILSRDEKKQDDLRKKINLDFVKFYLGDVRDQQSVDNAVVGVDYIFHASALKQVPSCDFFPMEAVKTNVIGTSNVLQSAKRFSVKKVVTLSTDKAVYPINAMGISKAMMEKVMIAESRNCLNGQVFCGTRYGNVIASRGSVIPLFINQIRNSGHITITNEKMTRFLMSLDEASDLVLYAFEHGNNGDIFVQKSPSADIITIAHAVIKLMGKSSSDVDIKVIGTRHGEKMHESLVNCEDMTIAEDLDRFYRIPSDNRDLNYNSYYSEGGIITPSSNYSSDSNTLLSVDEVVDLLACNKEVQEALGNH